METVNFEENTVTSGAITATAPAVTLGTVIEMEPTVVSVLVSLNQKTDLLIFIILGVFIYQRIKKIFSGVRKIG